MQNFNLKYFLWLSEQALDSLTALWPVCITLLILILIALKLDHPKEFRATYLMALLPFGLTILILISGTLLRNDYMPPRMPSWVGSLPDILLFAHIPAATFLVHKLRDIRFAISAITLVQVWISFWAAAFAGMAISGVWV